METQWKSHSSKPVDDTEAAAFIRQFVSQSPTAASVPAGGKDISSDIRKLSDALEAQVKSSKAKERASGANATENGTA